MYGPPRDCKGKVRARRQVCANVFGLIGGDHLSGARMSCARVCPYKSVGCSFETNFGIRLRTRRCACSFVAAAPRRPWWIKIARRSSAGKWERVSASKPQASFPHYFMRQSHSLSADSLVHSTAQPKQSARACWPSRPQRHSWELWRRVHQARLRSVLGRA
jgi:hypothetical protein